METAKLPSRKAPHSSCSCELHRMSSPLSQISWLCNMGPYQLFFPKWTVPLWLHITNAHQASTLPFWRTVLAADKPPKQVTCVLHKVITRQLQWEESKVCSPPAHPYCSPVSHPAPLDFRSGPQAQWWSYPQWPSAPAQACSPYSGGINSWQYTNNNLMGTESPTEACNETNIAAATQSVQNKNKTQMWFSTCGLKLLW